jgi:N-acetylmuramoyl-L-alanine amidase
MNIEVKLLDVNKYSRPGTKRSKTTKIAWHYVGNAGSSALANRNYFNNAPTHKTYASSHYIVGLKGEIIQCVPDDEIAYTTNSANSYSIGIEVCHPDSTGKFNEVTERALIELTAMLCEKYGLNSKDIIRHYDVTKKKCPLYYVNNVSAYENARNEVQKILDGVDDMEVQQLKIKINGQYYEVEGLLVDDRNYIKVRDLEKAGFKIDNEGSIAVVESPCCCGK